MEREEEIAEAVQQELDSNQPEEQQVEQEEEQGEEQEQQQEEEGQEEEQEEQEEEEQQDTYEFSGRKLTAAELAAEAKKLHADYTKKSQELAELKRGKQEAPEKEEPAKSEYDEEDRKIAKQLLKIALNDPEMKNEFGLVTRSEIEHAEQIKSLDNQFKSLESKYSGKDGLPKFDIDEMVEYMKENGYAPSLAEVAYKSRFESEIIAAKVQQTLKKKGGYQTDNEQATPKKVAHTNPMRSRDDIEAFVMNELNAKGEI